MAPESTPLTVTPAAVLAMADRLDAFADRMMDDYRPGADDVIVDIKTAVRLCRHAVTTGWIVTSVSIPARSPHE
jgi:hypothetical protein